MEDYLSRFGPHHNTIIMEYFENSFNLFIIGQILVEHLLPEPLTHPNSWFKIWWIIVFEEIIIIMLLLSLILLSFVVWGFSSSCFERYCGHWLSPGFESFFLVTCRWPNVSVFIFTFGTSENIMVVMKIKYIQTFCVNNWFLWMCCAIHKFLS